MHLRKRRSFAEPTGFATMVTGTALELRYLDTADNRSTPSVVCCRRVVDAVCSVVCCRVAEERRSFGPGKVRPNRRIYFKTTLAVGAKQMQTNTLANQVALAHG